MARPWPTVRTASCGLCDECWAMRMKEEHILNKTGVIMLRCIHWISVKDHASSDEIQKRAKVMPIVADITMR